MCARATKPHTAELGQWCIAAYTYSVVVVFSDNPFSPAAAAVPRTALDSSLFNLFFLLFSSFFFLPLARRKINCARARHTMRQYGIGRERERERAKNNNNKRHG